MIKLSFLALALLFLSLTMAHAQAPEESALFQSVFGKSAVEASVPLALGGVEQGEVRIRLAGETLVAVEKKTFFPLLSKIALRRVYKHIENAPEWIPATDLHLALRYNPVTSRLEIEIPPEDQKGHALTLSETADERYGDEALYPAPIGGAINYRVEKAFGSDRLGGHGLGAFLDSFVNVKGVVLENQSNYQDGSTSGTGWFRGDTRLVKDFPKSRVRTQVGDVYPQGFGFMPAAPVGGVMVARNFTLNPYRIPFPQGRGNFVLRTRSRVRTFVNGVQVKDETLPAGNYDLREVPLVNGLNTVQVEVTDELGEKRVYEFRLPTSVGLLNKGDWNFSLSYGRPFLDNQFHRSYQSQGLTSAYAQHGITQQWSLGGYGQARDNYYLTGTETGLATWLGNFFVGAGRSRQDDVEGNAASATWQRQKIGTQLFSTYTLTLRHERYGSGFNAQGGSTSAYPVSGQVLKSQWLANVTVPVRERLTASVGSSIGDTRDPDLANRHGWDLALNLRAMRNLNINFFISRNRDEHKNWNDVAYAFFTWTFDGANHLISGFHDFKNNVNRLSAIRDNNNRLYSPRVTGQIEEGPDKDGGEVDGFVPTPMADFGGRVTGAKYADSQDSDTRGVARISSALVFAWDKGRFGVGMSRPVPNSFVLFKPSPELRKQKVALRSTSPFTEGESGPFGEITFTNLLPYQYREIQLDPSRLEEGTSLEKEKYVVYPTYRSAHLIPLNDKGTVVLTGVLVDAKGLPMVLKVGAAEGKPFFTSREGRFFIEGLDKGPHVLRLDGDDGQGVAITIEAKDRGVKDLGTVPYPTGDQP